MRHRLGGCPLAIFLVLSLTGADVAPANDAAVAALVAARRPHPAELAIEARLAEAARRLTISVGVVRDGVTLSAEAGPRRAGGESETDLALGLDLPLTFAGREQRAAAEALRAAAPPLRAAATAEAELAIALAALELWQAEETARLGNRELIAIESWLSESVRRAEAGALAAYEPILVRGELSRTAAEQAAALAAVGAARERLAALVEFPSSELPAVPRFRAEMAPLAGAIELETGAPARAARASAALDTALAALEAGLDGSRWGLAGSLTKEGDEEVARLGVAYRFPPRGEGAALAARRETERALAERDGQVAVAALAVRLAAARALLAAPVLLASEDELARAERAVELRLAEGHASASELLPLRRSLVEARRASLAATAARWSALFEIAYLTSEVNR